MNRTMTRAFATVGGWTMGSRVLGFVRDMLMARILGAGLVADAFNAAFLLPNLFRRFLAEGAFNSAFLPQFAKKHGDHEAAQDFAQNSFASLMVILFVLIALIQIFMPVAIFLLVSGFVGNERFEMAQHFSRITIFYIAFMTMASLCGSILNSYSRFGLAAAAPILLNIILIAALIGTQIFGVEDVQIGIWLSWAVFVAGIAQFLLVYSGVRRLGFRFRLGLPKWNAELKTLFVVFLPAMAASGVGQINLVVGRQIASWTDGAVSWLNYADRLYQLPLGVVGVAVGTVLLTSLTEARKAGDEIMARDRYNDAVFFAMLLVLPAALAIVAIPEVLIGVVFEGGAFGAKDTVATARAVAVLALALPAAVLQLAQMKLFYAREDTRTPFRYALISMLVNVGLAIGLWRRLGYMAPVVANVVASYVICLLLYFGSRRFGEAVRITSGTRKRLWVVFVSAVIMAVCAYGLAAILAPWLSAGLLKWLVLLMIVAVAMVIYFALVFLLLGMKPRELKGMLRR